MAEPEPAGGDRLTAAVSTQVVLYGTRACPYCVAARHLLKSLDLDYEDISVDGDRELRQHMETISGRHTVPQIWISDTHIGGYTELHQLVSSGKLEAILGDARP